jgi:hypothetical protein
MLAARRARPRLGGTPRCALRWPGRPQCDVKACHEGGAIAVCDRACKLALHSWQHVVRGGWRQGARRRRPRDDGGVVENALPSAGEADSEGPVERGKG